MRYPKSNGTHVVIINVAALFFFLVGVDVGSLVGALLLHGRKADPAALHSYVDRLPVNVTETV